MKQEIKIKAFHKKSGEYTTMTKDLIDFSYWISRAIKRNAIITEYDCKTMLVETEKVIFYVETV